MTPMSPMSKIWLAGILGLGLVACTSAAAKEPERDADRRPVGHRAVDRTLVAGTLVEVTMHSSVSHGNKPGETLMGVVTADVRNAHRWVVIPAGGAVSLAIAPGRPAGGKMQLDVTSVTVGGRAYPVHASQATGEVVVARGTRILFVLPEGFTAARRPGEMP